MNPEALVPSSDLVQADELLLDKKLQIAMGIFIDVYGVGNISAAGGLLYDAVFHPDTVVEDRHIPLSERFPDRGEVLSRPLATLRTSVPRREEFVELFRDTVTRDIDHQVVLYPGALEAVRSLACHGPLMIWTHGDMHGQPEQPIHYNRSELPEGEEVPFDFVQPAQAGSYEQLKKIVGGGIATLRRELASRAMEAVPEGSKKQRILQNTIAVHASENKFSEQALAAVRDYFKKNNVQAIVVIEDKLSNIQALQKAIGSDLTVRGLWVGQGKNGELDLPYDHDTVTKVATIRDAAAYVEELDNTWGTLCDFDGVLSDHAARKQLYAEAVRKMFKDQGWIL